MADQVMLQDALEGQDWTRYAGPGADVRRRGEAGRRRRRTTVLGAAALVAIGAALPVVWMSAARRHQDPATDTPVHVPGVAILPKGAPYTALASGVVGEGYLRGLFWQDAWATIPSQSAANSQPLVTCGFVTLGTATRLTGCAEGRATMADSLAGFKPSPMGDGFATRSFDTHDGFPASAVFADGVVPQGTTSLTLRWGNGRTQSVPFLGDGRAAFAFLPDDPPSALVEQGLYGTKTMTVASEVTGMWHMDNAQVAQVVPASPPPVEQLDGNPAVTGTPAGKTVAVGVLGQGTVGGHRWKLSYRVIPSASADNDSPYVTCTYQAVDGVIDSSYTSCGSSPFPGQPRGLPSFSFADEPDFHASIVLQTAPVDDQTTAVGLAWSDGTQSATAVARVNGTNVATVAFDPRKPPAYVLMIGSYGEKRIPVVFDGTVDWTVR